MDIFDIPAMPGDSGFRRSFVGSDRVFCRCGRCIYCFAFGLYALFREKKRSMNVLLRHTLATRINHWLMAACMIALLLTGFFADFGD